ncbi:guanylate kinase [Candidatus Gracilibacteria bacterium]|nr:guanylate kinase [Candidatus Gracilibacteria bacterium]
MKKKKVFILSGPAGVGKNTLWDGIRKDCENFLEESTSATSRAPRAGEVNGREYHFLTKVEFEKQIHEHAFLEYAIVHTNYYGSPKSELERITKKGKTPIYIIEPQGMTHIKPILEEMGYEVVTIFLLPPSLDELKRRIKNRGTETEEQFQIRLATAMTEFEQQDFYDIRIVNDDIEKTKKELIAILKM